MPCASFLGCVVQRPATARLIADNRAISNAVLRLR